MLKKSPVEQKRTPVDEQAAEVDFERGITATVNIGDVPKIRWIDYDEVYE